MSQEEIAAGWHAVRALLDRRPESVHAVWLSVDRHDRRAAALLRQAQTRSVEVRRVDAQTLERRADGLRHQGVIALCRPAAVLAEPDLWALLERLEHAPLLLVLDQVQDPHNLGACLRSADAAGADAVIAPRDRAAGVSSVVRRTAAGAAESVPFVQVTNLARCLRGLRERGIWLTGLAGEASDSFWKSDLTAPSALVLGAEGRGLRRLTREHCDFLVSLPMRGAVESLNVSAAAAVCLYEARRQREGFSR